MADETSGPFRLDGKVAVVTGGSRGIGRAIAQAFADAGARVVVCSRKLETCEAVARELGGGAVGLRCDVADAASVDALFEAVAELGGADVFVHNAGLATSSKSLETPRGELQQMLDVHFLGGLQGAQRAAAQMQAKGGGAILLITSIWGIGGNPTSLAYGTAKAALAHAVKTLSIEWARHGIRVNGLAPGFVDTDMTAQMHDDVKAKLVKRVPMRRYATPEEMGHPALFLCTEAASYVTGHVLVADGGERAR